MKTREMLTIVRYPSMLALVGAIGAMSVGPLGGFAQDGATGDEATATEDVIYLNDHRVFRGKIISEDQTSIRLEFVHMGVKTTRSFFKWDIAQIDRNVAVSQSDVAEEEVTPDDAAAPAETIAEEKEVDLSLPGIYVIPIRGQMGTDVLPETYEEIIDDVKSQKPACIVFEIDCDHRNWMLFDDQGQLVWPGEYYEFEDYRKLVQTFKRELSDFRQVMWVKNAVGTSSMVTLAWNEVYMQPEARLDGLVFANMFVQQWTDADVRAKMKSAWSGIVKSFIEHGKHDLDLIEAMMFPEEMLSADFRGREVLWDLDTDGEVLIDNTDEVTAGFDAEDARNLRISQETVDREGDDGLADLAFMLGFREYRKIDGIGEKAVSEYIANWRETYRRCITALQDFNQYLSWATGEDEAKYIGQAMRQLEFIRKAFMNYRAVERELGRNFGMDLVQLDLRLRELRERLRGIQERERTNPSRPGAPGGGGGPRPGG